MSSNNEVSLQSEPSFKLEGDEVLSEDEKLDFSIDQELWEELSPAKND